MDQDLIDFTLGKNNFEDLSDQRLQELCAAVLVEFWGAISECNNAEGVSKNLKSHRRKDMLDGLWRVRGALNRRQHESRMAVRAAEQAERAARYGSRRPRPSGQKGRVVIDSRA